MSGIFGGLIASGRAALDIQTVTTGGSGTAPLQNRLRGWSSASLGSIVDGTSNIYGGAAITTLFWNENEGGPNYQLTITGATNSGWTTLTIGSQSFLRASASFGSGSWFWSTSDTLGTQSFGSIGSTITCTFT
jgi:hypothetical protein